MTETATPYAEDFEYRGYRVIQKNTGGMVWIEGAVRGRMIARAPFVSEAVEAVDALIARDAFLGR